VANVIEGALGKQRLEALVDGIFAVAMTLLVLELKLPENVVYPNDHALWARLVALERHFLIYVLSFAVTGMFWIGHHLQFQFVRAINRQMIWINMLYLLLVSFVPFATDLVGDHKELTLPCEIYGATLLALTGVAYLHTRYLARRPALATVEFTPRIATMFERRALLFAIVPIVSMLVAFFDTHLALYVYLLLVPFHLLANPFEHVALAHREGEEREAREEREKREKRERRMQ
jgi:uncharacterized membrane protein